MSFLPDSRPVRVIYGFVALAGLLLIIGFGVDWIIQASSPR
jgi:hypothetical protein